MTSQEWWQLFVETGAPDIYLMYNQSREMEQTHVFDDSGIGAKGYCV